MTADKQEKKGNFLYGAVLITGFVCLYVIYYNTCVIRCSDPYSLLENFQSTDLHFSNYMIQLYATVCHVIMLFLGNKVEGILVFQIFLRLVTCSVFYAGLVRISSKKNAIIVLILWNLLPISLISVISFDGMIFQEFFFSVSFFLIAKLFAFMESSRSVQGEFTVGKVEICLSGAFVGIFSFLDLTGVWMVIAVNFVFLFYRKNNRKIQGTQLLSDIKKIPFYLNLGIGAGFLGSFLVRFFSGNKSLSQLLDLEAGYLKQWLYVWINNLKTVSFLEVLLKNFNGWIGGVYPANADFYFILADQLRILAAVMLLIFLVLSLLRIILQRRGKLALLPFRMFPFVAVMTLVLTPFAYEEQGIWRAALFSICLLTVLDIENIFEDQSTITARGKDDDMKNRKSLTLHELEAKEAVQERNKTDFIPNPLPVPKKHEPKTMDYDHEIPENKMHFDIELTNKRDDYDLRD